MRTAFLPFVASAILAGLLMTGCQNVPKYKTASGKFDEWKGYEGRNFAPSSGTVTAVDATANTVTISRGKDSKVYPVTAQTRIMHEGDDIPLAKLPLNTAVKYTISQDGQRLLTLWYGHAINRTRAPQQHQDKNTFYN
jgi:hypothetical protein